ncbi:MAG: hypothetical protein HDS84_01345 [Bacteroidales bacterium]|nr:hypothetical protein [Bacteroidales bacterium]
MKKYKKTYAIHTLAEKHTTFYLGKTKVHVSFTGGQVTKNGVNPATFTTSDPIVQLAIERSKEFENGAVTVLAQYPMQGEVKIGKNSLIQGERSELQRDTEAAGFGHSTPTAGFGHSTPTAGLSHETQTAGIGHTNPPAGIGHTTLECNAAISNKEAITDVSVPMPHPNQEDKPESLESAPVEDTEYFAKESREESHSAPEESGEVKTEESGEVKTEESVEVAPELVEVSCKDVAKQYLQEHYGEKPARLRTIADVQECAAKYGITFKFV